MGHVQSSMAASAWTVVLLSICLCSAVNQERLLQASLMSSYSRSVRPVLNDSDTLTVSIGMAVLNNQQVDQVGGTVRTNLWLRMWWTDANLVWTPADWGNVSFTTFGSDPEHADAVWTPDIYLYNTGENPMEDLAYTRVTVYSDGSAQWSRPGILTSTMFFKLENFPFDSQTLTWKFGSWAYNDKGIIVSPKELSVDLGSYVQNPEWAIQSTTASSSSNLYGIGSVFTTVQFEMSIKRRAQFYMTNLVAPVLAIA